MQGVHEEIRALPLLALPPLDVVIFVSPEYRVAYVKEFLARSNPKLAIFMVRGGAAFTRTEQLEQTRSKVWLSFSHSSGLWITGADPIQGLTFLQPLILFADN